MNNGAEHPGEKTLGPATILIHLGLATCGIAALLTGLLVDDDNEIGVLGFALHSWAGMAAASFIAVRMVLGIVGPAELRFGNWVYPGAAFPRDGGRHRPP